MPSSGGPNDSGKSTLLRAVEEAMSMFGPYPQSRNPWRQIPDPDRSIQLRLNQPELEVGMRFKAGSAPTRWLKGPGGAQSSPTDPAQADFRNTPLRPLAELVRRGARFVQWDPDVLRRHSGLIPEDDPVRLYDERGHGLPGVLDVIFNRGDDARDQIQEKLRVRFPTLQAIRLRNISQSEKALEAQLVGGERVPAQAMSEGMLFYLAFLAIQHLEPPAVFLVEEPETGLHPSRIADVMQILRDISKTTQVLIATHSPLVVNELSGDEVSVVTRSKAEGTVTRLLKDTANFEERREVYALGELWLSYANGEDEQDLLGGSRGSGS